jgi:hypothetical protein
MVSYFVVVNLPRHEFLSFKCMLTLSLTRLTMMFLVLTEAHPAQHQLVSFEEPETPLDCIWKDTHIVQNQPTVANGLKKSWTCLHCNKTFLGCWNVSKVKAHLAKKKHHDVGICTAMHTREEAAYYQQHYIAMVEASKKRKCVTSAVGEASATRREDGAASLMSAKASKKKARNCSPSTSGSGTTTPNSTSTIDTVDLTTNALAPFKHVRGTIQTFLTPSSTLKEAVANMDYAMGAYIIEGGLAFRNIEDRNLLEIIKLARTVPFNYKPPTRKRLTDEILPLLHKQRQDANLALLEKDKEIFGLQLYGDGATIKHKPLFNFLAAGGHVVNAVIEIRDCTSQMASGGKKSAEYLAGIMEGHLKLLDPTGECCDFVLMDGAANVQKAGRILEARHPRITSVHGSEHGITL